MSFAVRTASSHDCHPLIVHSHLRWDFVWQRPQQILSRLGRSRPVLYVEEPVFLDDIGVGTLDVTTPCAGIYRVVPRLPASLHGSYDDSARAVRSLILALVDEGGPLAGVFQNSVQWFYTPMPASLMIGAFGERGTVYDCMDELSQFRFAPPDLTHRERLLLAEADVVFTGGRQLFESKSRHHHNVHFFGCGVDADHFARAHRDDTPIAPELERLPRPVLGYVGVIDERLDYELIGQLAERFAQGSLVFVGPLAKVDPAELPKHANIVWLGQRPYEALPEYVKGFDVCLMPFALNEATEYINPTKTLEYMAAGKPIVSTAVPDVVRNFTPIVRIARTIDEFMDAAGAAMQPDPDRIEAGIVRARTATWESIVAAMDRLITDAIDGRHVEPAATAEHVSVVAMRRRATANGSRGRTDALENDAANVA